MVFSFQTVSKTCEDLLHPDSHKALKNTYVLVGTDFKKPKFLVLSRKAQSGRGLTLKFF